MNLSIRLPILLILVVTVPIPIPLILAATVTPPQTTLGPILSMRPHTRLLSMVTP